MVNRFSSIVQRLIRMKEDYLDLQQPKYATKLILQKKTRVLNHHTCPSSLAS